MAVDVCSEIASLVVSPRISFSHDLQETDDECHHYRSDAFLLESTIDFDFCLTNQTLSQHQISSADELFSNGKILPASFNKSTPFQQIKQSPKQQISEIPRIGSVAGGCTQTLSLPIEVERLFQKRSPAQALQSNKQSAKSHQEIKPATSNLENVDTTKKKRLKEFLSNNLDEETEKQLPQSKPFWQFRRSNSLNCENGRSNGLIRSSLQFLSRSNSTGSAPNKKQPSSDLPKIFQKEQVKVLRKSSSLSSSSTLNQNHPLHSSSKRGQSHPLKKSYSRCRSYGNGVKISPVLNLPPTYISKGTVCLFGLGSLFCSGKSKKKK